MGHSWNNVHPDIVTCFALHPALETQLDQLQQLNIHWRNTIEANVLHWRWDLRLSTAHQLPPRFEKIWRTATVCVNANSYVSALPKLTSLTSLKLRQDAENELPQGASLGESIDLSWLPVLAGLASLELSSFRWIPRSFPCIQHMDSLLRLTLTCMNLGDSDLEWLWKLQNLKLLDLGGCTKIGDRTMSSVMHLHKLEQLVLYQTKVTGAGVEKLQCLRELQDLNLVMCAKDVVPGLLSIANNVQLKKLDLFQVGVEEHDLLKLKAAFPEADIL